MTSNPSEAYVWIWLPNQVNPVVAGRLGLENNQLIFNYGQSYLGRKDAIAIYDPELPLREGRIDPLPGMEMPSCIRDGSPDAWGRRVIINKVTGKRQDANDVADLGELSYLLLSGSDRIGALDFQVSPETYSARNARAASLEELQTASEMVDKGIPLSPELDQALNHGTSIGGARPKANLVGDGQKFIAKFTGSTDTYSVVKAEYIAMRLAEAVGIEVAGVKLTQALGKDVLLIERFDRYALPADPAGEVSWARKSIVSALTILGLPEMEARYASYEMLAESIRYRFTRPRDTLHELFKRMVFNVLVGNTDDHARNHAAFWDGSELTLVPAYDICPQSRTGEEASQAMSIRGENKLSQLGNCLGSARSFQLSKNQALEIISQQVGTIVRKYPETCADAQLSEVDQRFFWRRQFLNPFCFYDLDESLRRRLTTDL
jgi:serine/threonine-protein kinase HipA